MYNALGSMGACMNVAEGAGWRIVLKRAED
jgi:hypothetical protein